MLFSLAVTRSTGHFLIFFGIGTTAPGIAGANRSLTVSANTAGQVANIEVQGNQTSDVDFAQLDFYNGSNRNAAIVMKRAGANNSAEMKFYTNNAGSFTQKMVLDKAGNLGIGATTPGAKVDIQASSTNSTHLLVNNAVVSNGSTSVWFRDTDTNAHNIFRVTGDSDADAGGPRGRKHELRCSRRVQRALISLFTRICVARHKINRICHYLKNPIAFHCLAFLV
jgi:hypothetical protein